MARIELKDNSSIKVELDDRFIIINRESNSLKFILCNEDSKIVDRGIFVQDAMHEKNMGISLEDISGIVSEVTGISLIAMKNPSRRRTLVDASTIYSMIARKYTEHPLRVIGEFISKNHSTVIYHIGRASDLFLYDKAFNLTVNKVENKIKDLMNQREFEKMESLKESV